MSIIIDTEKYIVIMDGQRFELPLKEFNLLCLLCVLPGKVYSRKQLFEKIWGERSETKLKTVDVHISNIRKKLDKNLIKNIIGVGYKVTIDKVAVI